MKTCVKCGSTNNPTRDHIIPQWFIKAFTIITKEDWKEWRRVRQITSSNYQTLCIKCNQEKSGSLDMNDKTTIIMVNEIIEKLSKLLKKQ